MFKISLRTKILTLLPVIAVSVPMYFLISGYIKSLPKIRYNNYAGNQPAAQYPDTRFAVISDLHIYDPSLGSTGTAFEKELYSDTKLLLESEALLDFAIHELLQSDIQFVLVPGDLTKDGERVNHEIVSAKLQKLVDAGIKVFVVPGNHDVNNPDASRFMGDEKQPVDSISADQFAQFYQNMGYRDAISRDSHSLSYVAQPVDGLWLVAIDSCRYSENVPGKSAIVGGGIRQESADWLAGVLEQAAEKNIAVIAMMHHGMMEHWNGQAKLHPDYIVSDYRHVGKFLASYHVRLGFTGHYHAQDIARAEFDGNVLYDIETGSLVTAPCPIRYCSIEQGVLTVRTDTIVEKLHPGTDFSEKSRLFVKETVKREAIATLKKHRVLDQDADHIANVVGDAFVAHYHGDEDASLRPSFDTSQLSLWGKIVYRTQKYVLDGLWHNSPPADNHVVIDLR
ncbi:MAG: metallophosphoesterase [Proteobacteria bacterium]|nr:metallophosphoesterase [Pseudomonadota bacterium]